MCVEEKKKEMKLKGSFRYLYHCNIDELHIFHALAAAL